MLETFSSHTLSDSFHRINETFDAITSLNVVKQITTSIQGCEAQHSPPFSAEVKNDCRYFFTPSYTVYLLGAVLN
jgi:hypothetical protein